MKEMRNTSGLGLTIKRAVHQGLNLAQKTKRPLHSAKLWKKCVILLDDVLPFKWYIEAVSWLHEHPKILHVSHAWVLGEINPVSTENIFGYAKVCVCYSQYNRLYNAQLNFSVHRNHLNYPPKQDTWNTWIFCVHQVGVDNKYAYFSLLCKIMHILYFNNFMLTSPHKNFRQSFRKGALDHRRIYAEQGNNNNGFFIY